MYRTCQPTGLVYNETQRNSSKMNDEFEGWCGIREAVELPEVSQVKEVNL